MTCSWMQYTEVSPIERLIANWNIHLIIHFMLRFLQKVHFDSIAKKNNMDRNLLLEWPNQMNVLIMKHWLNSKPIARENRMKCQSEVILDYFGGRMGRILIMKETTLHAYWSGTAINYSYVQTNNDIFITWYDS